MTDRQFVKACLKISEKWGKIYADRRHRTHLERNGTSARYNLENLNYKQPVTAWENAARLCAEWLEEQVLKCKCLISRHYSDNRITLGDCSLEFSNTDYRTALLSAAQKLIEEGK